MGSGIAKEIRQRYPEAWQADFETTPGDIFKLGSFTSAHTGKFIIVNAYTQYNIAKNGEDVFEYASFEVILKKLQHVYGNRRIGLPYIGMGLANGDKNRIMELIEHFSKAVSAKGGSVTLVRFG